MGSDGKKPQVPESSILSPAKRSERRRRAGEKPLFSLLEILPHPVYISRLEDGRLLFVNRKASLLLGAPMDALYKCSAPDFFQDEKDWSDFEGMLATIHELHDLEIQMKTRLGRGFLAEVAAIEMDYEGTPAVLVAFSDVSERKKLEAELLHQATTDALTGIGNRNHIMAQGEREIRRGRRHGRNLSVLMLDIDHFKAVNDQYGHAAGDVTLQEFVHACRKGLRQCDLMGRLGGEEFVVILPETAINGAVEVAERLRRMVQETRISFEGKVIPCTVSIGVSELLPSDSNLDSILKRADDALYNAKHNGRNQVQFQSS